ncbi:MAG TPA: hypothetical protein PK677_12875 [Acidiphilium sp.]|nr:MULTISPECIES: hypothetical protein [unclassified Acidiphilium]HQT89429.1 hypothetical protein [Acidiphilium sp.]
MFFLICVEIENAMAVRGAASLHLYGAGVSAMDHTLVDGEVVKDTPV